MKRIRHLVVIALFVTGLFAALLPASASALTAGSCSADDHCYAQSWLVDSGLLGFQADPSWDCLKASAGGNYVDDGGWLVGEKGSFINVGVMDSAGGHNGLPAGRIAYEYAARPNGGVTEAVLDDDIGGSGGPAFMEIQGSGAPSYSFFVQFSDGYSTTVNNDQQATAEVQWGAESTGSGSGFGSEAHFQGLQYFNSGGLHSVTASQVSSNTPGVPPMNFSYTTKPDFKAGLSC